MTSDDIARWVAEVRFTPVRMREGYDMGEVDVFLDRVVAVAGEPGAIAALVRGARFTPVRLREGYKMAEVDAFLAGLVGAEPASHVSAPAPAPRPLPARSSYDGGITESRSWWSRLFGPKGR
ncbi:DivIVA domain-containing protein [Nocardioides sp. WS12]|uniref:DivIVA domain-containing protein n=1 Tax=Nocardioides sp. WS12 TaxID=2486272 RepID=UPI0015FC00EB|nr:DivIVA domain-containing protein [Nocardioides sp. WS12]